MPFDWGKFLQNNAGNLIGAGGALIEGRANRNQQAQESAASLAQREKERQDQMRQFLLSLYQRSGEYDRQLGQSRYEYDQSNRLSRDRTGVEATQLDPYTQQRSRQSQAIMAAMLPGMRNASVSSNIPGMNQFIPQVSGGVRIPEGGFGQDVLSFFSPESRANAEGEYWRNAAPFAEPPNLSNVGYGQAGASPTAGAQQARNDFLARDERSKADLGAQDADARKRQEALMSALMSQANSSTASTPGSAMGTQPKSGGGGMGTLAKVGLTGHGRFSALIRSGEDSMGRPIS